MRMRMPKIPLFTIDPYFSVWSQEPLNEQRTKHWTDAPCTVTGTVTVDGTAYRFLGAGSDPCCRKQPWTRRTDHLRCV